MSTQPEPMTPQELRKHKRRQCNGAGYCRICGEIENEVLFDRNFERSHELVKMTCPANYIR